MSLYFWDTNNFPGVEIDKVWIHKIILINWLVNYKHPYIVNEFMWISWQFFNDSSTDFNKFNLSVSQDVTEITREFKTIK